MKQNKILRHSGKLQEKISVVVVLYVWTCLCKETVGYHTQRETKRKNLFDLSKDIFTVSKHSCLEDKRKNLDPILSRSSCPLKETGHFQPTNQTIPRVSLCYRLSSESTNSYRLVTKWLDIYSLSKKRKKGRTYII